MTGLHPSEVFICSQKRETLPGMSCSWYRGHYRHPFGESFHLHLCNYTSTRILVLKNRKWEGKLVSGLCTFETIKCKQETKENLERKKFINENEKWKNYILCNRVNLYMQKVFILLWLKGNIQNPVRHLLQLLVSILYVYIFRLNPLGRGNHLLNHYAS